MNKLIHTPEGVRDIYSEEYKKRQYLQNRILDRIHLYGYENIQTPTFEFFDVFVKEMSMVSAKELFKFFDRDGNTLVLRPDFTPSIARACAKYFTEDKSRFSKVKYAFHRVFISEKVLEKHYPFVYRHKALYPLLPIYRLGKGIVKHPKRLLAEYKNVKHFKKKEKP